MGFFSFLQLFLLFYSLPAFFNLGSAETLASTVTLLGCCISWVTLSLRSLSSSPLFHGILIMALLASFYPFPYSPVWGNTMQGKGSGLEAEVLILSLGCPVILGRQLPF